MKTAHIMALMRTGIEEAVAGETGMSSISLGSFVSVTHRMVEGGYY